MWNQLQTLSICHEQGNKPTWALKLISCQLSNYFGASENEGLWIKNGCNSLMVIFFVKPLEFKLKVYTSVTSGWFDTKCIVVMFRGKITKNCVSVKVKVELDRYLPLDSSIYTNASYYSLFGQNYVDTPLLILYVHLI